jgi:hypothetical protein
MEVARKVDDAVTLAQALIGNTNMNYARCKVKESRIEDNDESSDSCNGNKFLLSVRLQTADGGQQTANTTISPLLLN